jgi:hypothetical protein
MSTNYRDSRPPRERTLSLFAHRVSPGRWLALIFVARAASFATGCSSNQHAAGTSGGACLQSCNDKEYCNDDTLVCDSASGLCVTNPNPPGDLAGCVQIDSPLCDTGEFALQCIGDSGISNECTYATSDNVGATYCCLLGPVDGDSGIDTGLTGDDANGEASSDASDGDAADE